MNIAIIIAIGTILIWLLSITFGIRIGNIVLPKIRNAINLVGKGTVVVSNKVNDIMSVGVENTKPISNVIKEGIEKISNSYNNNISAQGKVLSNVLNYIDDVTLNAKPQIHKVLNSFIGSSSIISETSQNYISLVKGVNNTIRDITEVVGVVITEVNSKTIDVLEKLFSVIKLIAVEGISKPIEKIENVLIIDDNSVFNKIVDFNKDVLDKIGYLIEEYSGIVSKGLITGGNIGSGLINIGGEILTSNIKTNKKILELTSNTLKVIEKPITKGMTIISDVIDKTVPILGTGVNIYLESSGKVAKAVLDTGVNIIEFGSKVVGAICGVIEIPLKVIEISIPQITNFIVNVLNYSGQSISILLNAITLPIVIVDKPVSSIENLITFIYDKIKYLVPLVENIKNVVEKIPGVGSIL